MWRQCYVSTAAVDGIVKGYDATHFGPNDLVTREQMMAMVVQAGKLAPVSGKLTFRDADQIDQWAGDDAFTGVTDGIVHEYHDGIFRPLNHATRAQAATAIAEILKYLVEENGSGAAVERGFAAVFSIPVCIYLRCQTTIICAVAIPKQRLFPRHGLILSPHRDPLSHPHLFYTARETLPSREDDPPLRSSPLPTRPIRERRPQTAKAA
ncbi:MAG: S-layer homology domain-containing protein [Peptococcaceae bacterium]|jgi:hypothetical protein|nr:S-layer homology domain-containing protein [Peptococcaceae bacterium]